jgi:hypothetical protein
MRRSIFHPRENNHEARNIHSAFDVRAGDGRLFHGE